jgi:hypothetical protein
LEIKLARLDPNLRRACPYRGKVDVAGAAQAPEQKYRIAAEVTDACDGEKSRDQPQLISKNAPATG